MIVRIFSLPRYDSVFWFISLSLNKSLSPSFLVTFLLISCCRILLICVCLSRLRITFIKLEVGLSVILLDPDLISIVSNDVVGKTIVFYSTSEKNSLSLFFKPKRTTNESIMRSLHSRLESHHQIKNRSVVLLILLYPSTLRTPWAF